jgi:hypothetical protein
MTFFRRHPLVFAFAILFTANMIGLALVAANTEGDRERAYDANVALCQTNYDLRRSVLEFVDAQTTPQPIPEDAPADVRQVARIQNQRREELRQTARDKFVFPPACVLNLGIRVDSDGRTLVPGDR